MSPREMWQRMKAGGWRRALPWVLGGLVGMVLGAACSPKRYTFLPAGPMGGGVFVCDHFTGTVTFTAGY